jgi:iron-sulfur cluster repair protein YtfE (RIC family)
MHLNHPTFENIEWSWTQNLENTTDIINQLIDQHTLVSDKLLPEIDMHFWALMNNNTSIDNDLIKDVYEIFISYKEQLEDHFYFEEKLVFPAFLKQSKTLDEVTLSFIQKHEDFESLLGLMITEIQSNLAPLRDLMSLRMLELKLARLVQIMEMHQILEDHLFEQH